MDKTKMLAASNINQYIIDQEFNT